MKIESFQNIFELVRPSFTSDLLDEDSIEIMGDICACFPMDFATFWGIECRIGEMAPRGDILFEIKRGAPGHFLLAGESRNLLDTLCEKACIWSKLRGLPIIGWIRKFCGRIIYAICGLNLTVPP
jgi:hypothetical protein